MINAFEQYRGILDSDQARAFNQQKMGVLAQTAPLDIAAKQFSLQAAPLDIESKRIGNVKGVLDLQNQMDQRAALQNAFATQQNGEFDLESIGKRLLPANPTLGMQFITQARLAAGETRKEDAPRAVVGVDAQGNQRVSWVRPSQGDTSVESKPASMAGSGAFTPETLKFTAQQYLAGDRQAAMGFARNATARIALQNAIQEEAATQGMSPQATAAKMAEFAGTVAGSRTVGQRGANIALAATEASEMLDIVKESSAKFGRTNFVPWNMALRAYESGTGSPEIAAFGASVNALVNVYARAINPTGVPTVSDKQHARDVLNTVQSPAQVDAVLGIIQRELDIAKRAPATVREATRAGIVGETPARRASDSAMPPVNAKGWKLMTDAKGNKAYVGPNKEIEEVR